MKFYKSIIALLLSIVSIITLTACKDDEKDERNERNEYVTDKVKEIMLIDENASDYTIVYEPEFYESATKLQSAIMDISGIQLETIQYDGSHQEKEIIIGTGASPINNPAWELLGNYEYMISAYGDKIIIAGSEVSIPQGVEHLIRLIVGSDNKENISLMLENGEYRPKGEEIALVSDGVSKYRIVRPDNAGKVGVEAASLFLSTIRELTGVTPEITTDWNDKDVSDYEILIGQTARYTGEDISSLEENDYIIKLDGNRLIIAGGSEQATYNAVRRFFIEFNDENSVGTGMYKADIYDISYTSVFTPIALKVMTQNVLNNDNHGNPDLIITKRIPRMEKLLVKYMPDIIGLQEFSKLWKDNLVPAMKKHGYETVQDTETKSSIMYNASKIKVHEVKCWYYSDTPNVRSYTWGENNTRLLTYAICEIIETKQKFVFINTHMIVGQEAHLLESRLKATHILLDKIKELNLPTICVGDFNCTSSSDPYKLITSEVMVDSRAIAKSKSGPAHTYNGLREKVTSEKIIDHIFLSKNNFSVGDYVVIDDKIDGFYVSDHYAVLCEVKLVN